MEFINQHMVMPRDLNPADNIFGGQILAWLDEAAGIYVMTKVEYANIVTYKMENVHFKNPAKNGDFVKIFGEIIETVNTRIIVKVRALSYNPFTHKEREVITCTVTFVCLDEKGRPYPLFKEGKPRPIANPKKILRN